MKIYNLHIICDNVLLLQFPCQKSLLMRVAVVSSKLVMMPGKTTLQRLICTLSECAVNALSLMHMQIMTFDFCQFHPRWHLHFDFVDSSTMIFREKFSGICPRVAEFSYSYNSYQF